MPRDYYEVLGVPRDAGETDIKKAFRRKARELHPDVNEAPNAEEEFKEVASAYEVLSDPERRATYDRYGHEGLRARGAEPDFSGFDGFSSVFDAFFGASGLFGGGRPGGPAQGEDIGAKVRIELGDVLAGRETEVEYEAVETCERCDGSRAEPGAEIVPCERCGGHGVVRVVTRTPLGSIQRQAVCDQCDGEGRIPDKPCKECHGQGRVRAHKSVNVEIPAGVEDGQQVRLRGHGHSGVRGGPPGDLYVSIRVAEDERFHREGRDLYTFVDVPVTDAMLGAEYEIETLDGEADIVLEPGVSNGDRVTLQGRGVPTVNDNRRGNLYAVVNLLVPRNLDEQQRALIEQLSDSLGDENLKPAEPESLLRRLRRVFG
jgi:molecular chaperone DnaJ